MKKDVYIITGIIALIIVAFILSHKYYSKPELPPPPITTTENTDTSSIPVNGTPSSETAPAVDMKLIVGDGRRSQGPIMAKITVVEFLDPECGACKAFHPHVKKVLAEFNGQIHYIVRYMPYHHNSMNAMKALEAALDQGKFFPFLDLLFEKQDEWGEKQDDATPKLVNYAKNFGLDMAKYKKVVEAPATEALINKDKKEGESAGVVGTPSFFVNGIILPDLGEAELRQAITAAMQKNQ